MIKIKGSTVGKTCQFTIENEYSNKFSMMKNHYISRLTEELLNENEDHIDKNSDMEESSQINYKVCLVRKTNEYKLYEITVYMGLCEK